MWIPPPGEAAGKAADDGGAVREDAVAADEGDAAGDVLAIGAGMDDDARMGAIREGRFDTAGGESTPAEAACDKPNAFVIGLSLPALLVTAAVDGVGRIGGRVTGADSAGGLVAVRAAACAKMPSTSEVVGSASSTRLGKGRGGG